MHPGTGQPVGPADLAPIFPMEIIKQEVSTERWIDIPEQVQDTLKLWRPTALYRAHNLEKALDTPAHIYYKWEGSSPAGSHKPNTAIPQAYYNMKEGTKRIATETGTGDDPDKMAANLARLESAALEVYKRGHLPLIGEWLALPLIQKAGSKKVGDAVWDSLGYPVADRILECCDAVLRLPGVSTGADGDVIRARALGLPIYYDLEKLPQGHPGPGRPL